MNTPQDRVIQFIVYPALVIITNGFPEGRHPYSSLRIAENLQHLQIRQAVFCGEILEMSTVEATNSGLRTGPDEPILILRNTINRSTGQTLLDTPMGIAVLLGKQSAGGKVQQHNDG